MYVGILTAPFGGVSLEEVAEFAGTHGFGGLEILTSPNGKHINTLDFPASRASEIRNLMEKQRIQISALASYTDLTHADPAARAKNIETVRSAIGIAKQLGVGVVCTLAGLPPKGKNRFQTIEEDCAEVFPPLLEHAAQNGVKLALENWYATNIQNLAHWDRLFEVVNHPNLGLNFDPSHLMWQGIDYIAAVSQYSSRIFHSHGKDTEIDDVLLRKVGNQGDNWWRYVIPGLGRVKWGQYLSALRKSGYNGAVSIEHEDSALGREEGFLIGKRYLEQFMAG